ncbi:MAG: hypothetical protein WBW14_28465 [Candidatus Acidiferrum sp.]
MELVVGLGCGQFYWKGGNLIRKAQSLPHYSMALHRGGFPMASGNAWLDRLGSLLNDGHLEVAIDKQYQGPARIETMAS